MSSNQTVNLLSGLLLYCLSVCSSQPVHAQGAVLDELYGQGVHSYFSGQYTESREMLTNAITQGSKDPRCYYFRGLCHLRGGQTSDAEADFKKGAELEMSGRDRVYPVGRSIQRIQGRDRLLLEKHRHATRIAAQLAALKVQLPQARNTLSRRLKRSMVNKIAAVVDECLRNSRSINLYYFETLSSTAYWIYVITR